MNDLGHLKDLPKDNIVVFMADEAPLYRKLGGMRCGVEGQLCDHTEGAT